MNVVQSWGQPPDSSTPPSVSASSPFASICLQGPATPLLRGWQLLAWLRHVQYLPHTVILFSSSAARPYSTTWCDTNSTEWTKIYLISRILQLNKEDAYGHFSLWFMGKNRKKESFSPPLFSLLPSFFFLFIFFYYFFFRETELQVWKCLSF